MLLIKNGRVVDPKSGLDTQADVLVDGKKVVKIAENIEAGDAQVIDATGLVVAPGLVDIHVHFQVKLIRKTFILVPWQRLQVVLQQL